MLGPMMCCLSLGSRGVIAIGDRLPKPVIAIAQWVIVMPKRLTAINCI